MGKKKIENPLEALCDRCGITKTWLAKQLGMSREAFTYALVRGLRPEEVEVLEYALKLSAKEMASFQIPTSFKQQKRKAA